ncbi:hypothetical protein N7451_001571 [Penicillium sp. IBT 35674x]|nr:hypothetical protein N7451_001571 [Penicillium sp. IBT 35674x]
MAAAEPRVKELASKLYDACVEQFDADHSFYQQDLLSVSVIPNDDVMLLLECAQSLVNQKLFRLLEGQNKRLVWRIVAREDAEKLRNLSDDEGLVFSVIHSSGRSGVWIRNIQNRTNLHKSILDRCLKSLESKNYIKTVHNVKHPTKKMYMLAGLAPSEDVTGGAWFTDGVLDANFINSVAGFIEYTVSRKSWYEDSADRGRSNKRIKTINGKADVKSETKEKSFLPYPANYSGYPTPEAITRAVNESGITPVQLTPESIIQLLHMLCFDKKLVALNDGKYYKSLKDPEAVKASQARKPMEDSREPQPIKDLGKNGMTESPCGPCPSFRLCTPGGAISPETCEYFDPWFEKNLGF